VRRWNEVTITWNNKPLTVALLNYTTVGNSLKNYEWDMTGYVLGVQTAGQDTVSFAFTAATDHNENSFFYTTEGYDKPQLAIFRN